MSRSSRAPIRLPPADRRPSLRSSTRAFAFFIASALVACTDDPVYLGLSGGASPAELTPIVCEEGCFLDRGLSAEEIQIFGSSDGRANLKSPKVAYPLSGSTHPSNLPLLTLHFEKSTNEQERFELRVSDEQRERRLYFPCLNVGGRRCTFHLPESFWATTASLFSGKEVSMKLRGATATEVSEEASLSLSFSPSPVLGGLYYWSAELQGLYRLAFGWRQAVPYISPETVENPDGCAGCHAVSRDGSTIAYTQGSASDEIFDNAAFDGRLRVARVTALSSPLIASPDSSESDSGMMTLSTNGSRVVSAYDYTMTLRDTLSGNLLDQVGRPDFSNQAPFFPEISPDDQTLVVTLSQMVDSEIAVRGGGLYTLSISGDRFGPAIELVPEQAGSAHYYPTWSPDGQWVAFVTGPASSEPTEMSYDQAQSRLRLVSVKTGQIFDLDAASGPPNSSTTWPKFAPFEQCEQNTDSCADNARIFFLSFSSKRPYGYQANGPQQTIRSQLWMSAIRTSRAREGMDPSSSPLWIPYQAHDTRNHLAYWTQALTCNENLPCESGRCVSGRCEDIIR